MYCSLWSIVLLYILCAGISFLFGYWQGIKKIIELIIWKPRFWVERIQRLINTGHLDITHLNEAPAEEYDWSQNEDDDSGD